MPNTLRDLQLCELQALKDIANVCEQHGIRYYLSSGTLLGAVRHQGFIPWDDDVDIEMPYEDYLKFLEVAPSGLGDRYFIQNSNTDPYYFFAFSRVRINGTTMMRDFEKSIPSHHGVWIDVFPLMYVGGKLDFIFKRTILRVCAFLRMDDQMFIENKDQLIHNTLTKIGYFFAKIARILPRQTRWNMRDRILYKLFSSAPKSHISCVWTTISCKYPCSVYDNPPSRLKFEDSTFSAPQNYDQYLKLTFGDYMTPPPMDQRNSGHGKLIIDLDHAYSPEG